jgi:hypothetical protein
MIVSAKDLFGITCSVDEPFATTDTPVDRCQALAVVLRGVNG